MSRLLGMLAPSVIVVISLLLIKRLNTINDAENILIFAVYMSNAIGYVERALKDA